MILAKGSLPCAVWVELLVAEVICIMGKCLWLCSVLQASSVNRLDDPVDVWVEPVLLYAVGELFRLLSKS